MVPGANLNSKKRSDLEIFLPDSKGKRAPDHASATLPKAMHDHKKCSVTLPWAPKVYPASKVFPLLTALPIIREEYFLNLYDFRGQDLSNNKLDISIMSMS
jgi:hypothetical protein